jgi:hypothetical protein
MTQLLFRDWRFALLWAIGISASVAAFFADGGGQERLAANAQEIREKRGAAHRQGANEAQPIAGAPESEEEPAEPAFGEPMSDPNVDDEARPKPAKPPARRSAEDEEAEAEF